MSAERIERVISLAERLIAALEADVAALEAGRPQDMRTIDIEIQKLSALYAREAASLNAAAAKAAPESLREKLKLTTARFREVLSQQMRVLTRMRNASEGIIHAVADEVGRRQNMARPYGPKPGTTTPRTGAMIYNGLA